MNQPEPIVSEITITEDTTADEIRSWLTANAKHRITAVNAPHPAGNLAEISGLAHDAEMEIVVQDLGAMMSAVNAMLAGLRGAETALDENDPASHYAADAVVLQIGPAASVAIINNGKVSDQIAQLIAR